MARADAGARCVSTYPNVLYGCAFGNCSPASMLPMEVSKLATVTSSWDFSPGGSASDRYNVAYDIWFCPDNGCGTSGFPGGLELMIWLDYKNVHGWQHNLGSVTLAGHTWEVWLATMGTAPDTWTYLAYMIKDSMVTSVSNLDLAAFFRDAAARGYIQSSSYLYAVQAGVELRTGGIPYSNNSFSISVNGITPSTDPVAGPSGPSCDGGLPVGVGSLQVSDNYVTAGPLHGYAAAWGWVGSDSKAVVCASPNCTAPGGLATTAIIGNGVAPLTAEPVTCSPAFAPSALCSSGTVTADSTYNQVAGVGFNLNQDKAIHVGVASDGGLGVDAAVAADGGGSGTMGAITIPTSITVSVSKSGTPPGNGALRAQVTDANGTFYCYGGKLNSGVPIPIGQFNTKCWNNSGAFATPSTPITRVDVLVPGSATTDQPFAFCLTDVSVQ